MSILEKLTNQMTATVESGLSLALHNKNQESGAGSSGLGAVDQ